MRFSKTICLAAAGLLSVVFADQCQAQLGRGHQPIQRPGRFLGLGYGIGYHHCNPGPDTSYYNPWSRHNSMLISNSPEYHARYGQVNRDPYQILLSQNSNFSPGFGQQIPGGLQSAPVTVDAQFEPIPTGRNDEETNDSAAEDFDSQDTSRDFQPQGNTGNGSGSGTRGSATRGSGTNGSGTKVPASNGSGTKVPASNGSGTKVPAAGSSTTDDTTFELDTDSIFQNSSFSGN